MSEGKATICLSKPAVDLLISNVSQALLVEHNPLMQQQAKPTDLQKFLATLWIAYSKPDTLRNIPSVGALKRETDPTAKLNMKLVAKELPDVFPSTLTALTIKECGVTRFPSRIFDLESLSLLDLSSNSLTDVPDSLPSAFPNLGRLVLAHNKLSEFSVSLCHPSLVHLDVSDNLIFKLPDKAGSMARLQHLDISENMIT